MLRLSFSAYASLKGHNSEAGKVAVGRALEFFGIRGTIEWFAVSQDHHRYNFALVFLVVEPGDEGPLYSVVVRGTNPLSLDSWFREDFDVGTQVPWPGSPTGGKISQAAATALSIHEGLKDGGRPLYEELKRRLDGDTAAGLKPRLRFTGHSLGGLVAPLLALRFSEKFPRWSDLEIDVCSFAAPTAGDAAFVAYLELSLLECPRQNFSSVRFIRCRDDLAIKVWNKRDMLGILRLYASYGIPINLFLLLVLAVARWSIRRLGYTQPFADTRQSTMFRVDATDVFALDSFEAEAYLEGGLQAQFRRAKALSRRHPSPRVIRNTLEWVVQAVVMHVVPYAIHLLEEHEQSYVAGTLLKTILTQDTLFVERRALPRGP